MKNNFMKIYGMAVLAGVLATISTPSHAQTIGGMMQLAAQSTVDLNLLLSVLSYIMGAVCGFLAVLKFKAWVDGQAPISDAVWRFFGSGALCAAPFIINALLNTVFSAWGNPTIRNNGPTAPAAGGTGLDQMMVSFVSDIYGPAKLLTQTVCYIVGIACVIHGIHRMAQAGQGAAGRAPKPSGTIGYMIGGAVLLTLGDLMDAITDTLFGSPNDHPFTSLSFAGTTGLTQAQQDQANLVFKSLFAFVEVMGWIAFARGVYLLIKLSQGEGGQRSHAHAFTHIVCGALAVNMPEFIRLFQDSLGVTNLFIT